MNKYNPDIHHRRSIRLRGYDYSQEGLYFVTICTQHHECLFGKITNGEMRLNETGRIVENEWKKLPERFNNVIVDVFQIMPNHFHGILQIAKSFGGVNMNNGNTVGAGLAPALNDTSALNNVRVIDNRATNDNNRATAQNNEATNDNNGATARVAPTTATVGNIVGAFKSLVTNECLKIYKLNNEYLGKLWQRNYHEHIIRNHNDYARIANYITNNPANWNTDCFYNQTLNNYAHV